MEQFFVFAYLFLTGAVSGWFLEVFFRRFFSKNNPGRKWINPGFCTGPYLPLYGFGLCLLYIIAKLCNKWFSDVSIASVAVLVVLMAVVMTGIEYVSGITCLKLFNIRLWDYRNERFNFQGLICPKFSFFWTVLGLGYYFLLHRNVEGFVRTLMSIIPLLFLCGMIYGILIIDVVHSAELVSKVRSFANDHDLIVNYERLKEQFRFNYNHFSNKLYFSTFFRAELGFRDLLEQLFNDSEERKAGKADSHGKDDDNFSRSDDDFLEKLKNAYEAFEERRWKPENSRK